MSPNEPRSVFTAAQRGRSQLKRTPAPPAPANTPCPVPQHPQLVTPVSGGAHGAHASGDGDRGSPRRSGHGQVRRGVMALGSVAARRQRRERNQCREGDAAGRNWSHWEDRSQGVHSTGCPSGPVPRPRSLLSPGHWLSCPSPGHKVPCHHIHGLSCPLGILSPGQPCPCGPQAPLSHGGCPLFPMGTCPTSSAPGDNSLRAVVSISPCPPSLVTVPSHPVSPAVMGGVAEGGDGELTRDSSW